MPGLILHCGGEKVDFEAIQASVTPEPEGYHYPIPHARILELAIEGLEKQGLHVVDGEHALANDGMRYFRKTEGLFNFFLLQVALRSPCMKLSTSEDFSLQNANPGLPV